VPETTLAARLQVKPPRRLGVVGAPREPAELIGPLPDGAGWADTPSAADVVLAFVRDRAELDERVAPLLGEIPPATILWIAYPKKTSSIKTDINRDSGWGPVHDAGWDPVSQIAIDETWSALRFTRDPELRASREARGARVGQR